MTEENCQHSDHAQCSFCTSRNEIFAPVDEQMMDD